jgi:hypothetical protein
VVIGIKAKMMISLVATLRDGLLLASMRMSMRRKNK